MMGMREIRVEMRRIAVGMWGMGWECGESESGNVGTRGGNGGNRTEKEKTK